NDGGTTQIPSPDLAPESIYSFEIEHSHRFSPTVTGIVSLYGNYVKNLITSAGDGTSEDPLHYVNASSPLLLAGAELAVRREWRRGFSTQASYAYQHATSLATPRLADLFALRKDPTTREVANAPEHLAQIKAAAPLPVRGMTIATRLTFEGPRYDRYESVTD